jgi:hypothetical protein
MSSVHQGKTRLMEWREQVVADPRLTDGQVRVAMALARHMDRDGGSCYPSKARLMDESGGKGRTTVFRALQHLLQLGYLRCEESPGIGGTTRYKALLPESVHADSQSAERDSDVPPAGPKDAREDASMHAGENRQDLSSWPPAVESKTQQPRSRRVPLAFADHPDRQTRDVVAACDRKAAEADQPENVRDEAATRLRRRMDEGAIERITDQMFLDECEAVRTEAREAEWLDAWLDRREAVEDLAGPDIAARVVRIPELITGPPRTSEDDLSSRLFGLLRTDQSLLGEYASWWARQQGCVWCGGDVVDDWIRPGMCGACRFSRSDAEADEARRVMVEREATARQAIERGDWPSAETRLDDQTTRRLKVAEA